MLITLMFSVVAEKSRNFFSFSYLVAERVCRSTARQTAKLPNGNIPYYKCHAQFINRGWLGGRNLSFSLP